MYKESALLFLYAETPLHAGSGTNITEVDLPIQREVHTAFPMIQGSGVKGVHRHAGAEVWEITPELVQRVRELERRRSASPQAFGEDEQRELDEKRPRLRRFEALFGPGVDDADKHSGALAFTDARILLFPVRSLVGVFAWITCPTVLARLGRDLTRIHARLPLPPLDLPDPGPDQAWTSATSMVRTPEGEVVLEDYSFQPPAPGGDAGAPPYADEVQELGEWIARHALPDTPAYASWKSRLPKALVVVADDVFRDFTRFGTEIVQRIRIGATGTVETGALWSEEHLPGDSLLYSLALSTTPRASHSGLTTAREVLESLGELLGEAGILQFGGDATVGRGLVQTTLRTEPLLRGAEEPRRRSVQPATSGA